MDQRFQQAQLKLPQAQVSAVSHNPGKINYQFFFSSLQWKKVVTRHKSDLVLRKRSAGRVSKAVNPSYLSTCPSRARLGGSQGRSPSAEGTICRDIQHKQTQEKEGEKKPGSAPNPSRGCIQPKPPQLGLAAPFHALPAPRALRQMPCVELQPPLPKLGGRQKARPARKKKKKNEHLHFATRTAAP